MRIQEVPEAPLIPHLPLVMVVVLRVAMVTMVMMEMIAMITDKAIIPHLVVMTHSTHNHPVVVGDMDSEALVVHLDLRDPLHHHKINFPDYLQSTLTM